MPRMNPQRRFVGLFVGLSLVAGCAGDHAKDAPDKEACPHFMADGAAEVAASPSVTGALSVRSDHRRYDVVLSELPTGGGKGGFVTFPSTEAAHAVFFLGAGVPFTVLDGNGLPITLESADTSGECAAVRGRHAVHLGVGTYALSLGPTAETRVSLVIERTTH